MGVCLQVSAVLLIGYAVAHVAVSPTLPMLSDLEGWVINISL